MASKDVANYLLYLSKPEDGDIISHLKLQKLLYYCQGFALALHGAPLFDDTIQAWGHGPVVPDLYKEYVQHGDQPIPPEPAFDPDALSPPQRDLIDEVYEVYGQFSAWKLRNLTHQEPPWIEAYAKGQNSEITQESMQRYFLTQLV